MIEQTYYPFGGENATLPTAAGISSFSNHEVSKETPNWLGWILLIATLIGIAGVVYWWRGKNLEL